MEKGEKMNTEFDEFVDEFLIAISKVVQIPLDLLRKEIPDAPITYHRILLNIHAAHSVLFKENIYACFYNEFLKETTDLTFSQRNQLIINDSKFDHNNYRFN